MNKYLLFYEKIGVRPKDLFLLDFSADALPLFEETCRKASQLIPSTTYYVNQKYLKLYRTSPRGFVGGLIRRRRIWRQHRYWVSLRRPRIKLTGIEAFQLHKPQDDEFYWGYRLEEPLLYYRGSLVTAINLATVLWTKDVDLYD